MSHSIRIAVDLYAMAQNVRQAWVQPSSEEINFRPRFIIEVDVCSISMKLPVKQLAPSENQEGYKVATPEVASNGELMILKERKHKDEEEIAAGRRSPRSLLMFSREDLKKFTFTPSPASEFERNGTGW